MTRRRVSSQQRTEKNRVEKSMKPWFNGMNRRDFMRGSLALALLSSLSACKPSSSENPNLVSKVPSAEKGLERFFSDVQKQSIEAVQLILFPDDGDGPSAADLHAFNYLEWAMTDDQNVLDGDPEYLAKGLTWLDSWARQQHNMVFTELTGALQEQVIAEIARSEAGESWLSLLLYYIIEALTLDPIYGGNPDKTGWLWLQHQGGFPQPVKGKTYRDFE